MSQSYWINGNADAGLEIRDRGLAYGDGLFETIKVDNHRPLLMARHLERLRKGAERLGIPVMAVDQLALDLNAVSLPTQGVLKLMLTRGAGGRGYAFGDDLTPTRIIMLAPLPDQGAAASAGIRARWCETRLGLNPQLAGMKHLNRLEQVLARREWSDADIREGLVLDYEGFVVEGTMSNLFWSRSGVVYTPDLTRCGVAGVIRQLLLEKLPQHGIRVEQGLYRPEEVATADELFVCNSVIDLWPVRRLAQHTFTPGPMTALAQQIIQQEYKL